MALHGNFAPCTILASVCFVTRCECNQKISKVKLINYLIKKESVANYFYIDSVFVFFLK